MGIVIGIAGLFVTVYALWTPETLGRVVVPGESGPLWTWVVMGLGMMGCGVVMFIFVDE
jgi:hypothetical protein